MRPKAPRSFTERLENSMNAITTTHLRGLLAGFAMAAVSLGAAGAGAGAVVHERPVEVVLPDDQPAGAAVIMQKVQKVKRLPDVMDDDWEHDAGTTTPAELTLPVDGGGEPTLGK
jgi:hypothetical protein